MYDIEIFTIVQYGRAKPVTYWYCSSCDRWYKEIEGNEDKLRK